MSEQGPGEQSVPRIWQILIIDTTQQEKTPFPSNGPPPFPVVGGHFRNQCFKYALNLVSGVVGQITNKLCDLFKGVKTLQIKYDFGLQRK